MVKDRALNKSAQPTAAHQAPSSDWQPEEMGDTGSALRLKQTKPRLTGHTTGHICH